MALTHIERERECKKVGAHRFGQGDEGGAAGLGEAVALGAGRAHGDLEELLHVARQRGAAAAHQAHAAAQPRLHLAEHQRVRQRRCLCNRTLIFKFEQCIERPLGLL